MHHYNFGQLQGLCRDESGNSDDRTVDFFIKLIKSNVSELPLFVFCTSHSPSDLSPNLKRIFLQSLHISAPNLESRDLLLKWILTRMRIDQDDLGTEGIAQVTSNFVYADLVQLICRAFQ